MNDFFEMMNSLNPTPFEQAEGLLQQAGICTPENKVKLMENCDDRDLFFALYQLLENGILNQENFDIVVTRDSSCGLANTLCFLHRVDLLTEANRAKVAAHVFPGRLEWALNALNLAGILTTDNLNLVADHPDYLGMLYAVCALGKAGNLSQTNLNALFAPNHAALVSEESCDLWTRIPDYLILTNFERLLTAAEHPDPITELARVRDQIIGVPAQAGAGAGAGAGQVVLNPGQSTHTTSVHRSVSDSALKLRERYAHHFSLEPKICEIVSYMNSLDDSPKHQAAKRCIARITPLDNIYTDALSGLSIRELLALSYVAIHDDAKRLGSLEDAKALFVEGLYEIQRGYNLEQDQAPEDGDDLPICAAGTFNKLMEKLNGVHADVELKYVTHQLATLKFPNLAQELALNYLKTQANPSTAEDYRAIKILLANLELASSLEPIWDIIKNDLASRLWEEFHEAYADNQEHPKFKEIIDNGPSLNLPKLDSLKHMLYASPGYRAYVASEQAQIEISNFGMFLGDEPPRHESDRPLTIP